MASFFKRNQRWPGVVDPSLLEVDSIKEALDLLQVTSYSDAELLLYNQCWDAVSSEKTLLSGRFKEGKAEGLAEGKAEVAITMYRAGLPLARIFANLLDFQKMKLKKLLIADGWRRVGFLVA